MVTVRGELSWVYLKVDLSLTGLAKRYDTDQCSESHSILSSKPVHSSATVNICLTKSKARRGCIAARHVKIRENQPRAFSGCLTTCNCNSEL